MKIPRRLIFFWHDKHQLPDGIYAAVNRTLARHRAYEAIFYDDEELLSHLQLHHPELVELYRVNRVPASRSDLARLVLLQAFGGIYLDAAMEVIGSLDDFLAPDPNEPELVLVRRDDQPLYADCPERAHVINGLMAASPGHPVIIAALALAADHLRGGLHNHNVWMATGAHCLNLALAAEAGDAVIKKLDFSQLSRELFVYRRDPRVSNLWVLQQAEGIMPST